MTPEQKLQFVIEGQVRGGYEVHELAVRDDTKIEVIDRFVFFEKVATSEELGGMDVIGILLDPEGLKAIYRNKRYVPCVLSLDQPTLDPPALFSKQITYAEHVAHVILEAWLSGGGEAAIDTAYSLLPK